MTAITKFNGAGKLIPIVDFFLLIVLILFSTSGFTRLERAAAPPVASSVFPAGSKSGDLEELRAENDKLRKELAQKQAELIRRQKQARAVAASHKAASEEKALVDRMAALKDEIARLKRELADLKAVLAQLRQQEAQLHQKKIAREAERRRQKTAATDLEKLLQENRALAEEIARLERPQAIPVESTPLVSLSGTRSPVYVAIIEGRIAPVKPPFFSMSEEIVNAGNGQFERVTRAEWRQTGETFAAAKHEQSQFQHVLRELRPREQYVALLVDSTSFETFRSVRAELRQRHLPFGWEPLLAREVQFAASGQLIGEDVQ